MTLEHPFLGSRNYVHGTTMYEDLSMLVHEARNISLRFIKPITTNVLEVVHDDPSCPAVMFYESRYGEVIGLRPTGEATGKREAWDEAASIKGAVFDGRTAWVRSEDFIRSLVALNKAMLQRLHGGSYLLRKLDLDRAPQGPQDIRLHLIYAERGQFASEIAGSVYGKIHFVRHE